MVRLFFVVNVFLIDNLVKNAIYGQLKAWFYGVESKYDNKG